MSSGLSRMGDASSMSAQVRAAVWGVSTRPSAPRPSAQKLILNMITTTSMIQLGKVYENMMVDLRMTSKKLEERAKKVLMIATGVNYAAAAGALKAAGGHVKSAIVMLEGNVSFAQAKK